ncbi:glycosyltransferase [Parapedobacter sp. 10938]|uniref:glycosyltransferase n=1 Tax=Parapedobacter flavus TaxID=3110225 RepID=UPI002DBC9BA3|nr:glycosyltransferase [Parapedobacter sp. 10938]MEC3882044.1 glycosyltransferase [Parapedobacter sp. 10938]
MDISFIIPVYNRPAEIKALLDSMAAQTTRAFEVVIMEDGSWDTCEREVAAYKKELNVKYFYKENGGPGLARNEACKIATGNFFIFLDSDCLLPPQYVSVVCEHLLNSKIDAFGGPDAAREDFSPLQKAINYSMTSYFTTGGIRGGSERHEKFHPRSFNMGYSREVLLETGGFSSMRFGEDIDMSLRMIKAGFQTKLIKEAFVYHRRRTSIRQFFKQIFNSGIARINLYKRHPDSLKLVHFAPAVFTVGVFLIILFSIFVSSSFLFFLILYAGCILLDATVKARNSYIGVLAVATSYIQLIAYGIGFIYAAINRLLLRKKEFAEFEHSFYE